NGLLSRYSGQTDLVVGSPIANRTHHQTEDLIGFFVNTLVLRNHLNGEQTFSQLLKQVRKTALEAYSHQDIPFEYLVEQLNPSRSPSHSPLFQVVLALQNAPREALELNGLKMSSPDAGHTTAKFDLSLVIVERGDGFGCNWEYNTDLFRPDTITRMNGHFQVLLEGILDNPEQPVCQLPLLTEAEKQQFLDWNHPVSGLTSSQTIVDLFEAQVEKTPGNMAVVFEEQTLSYRELNTRSNRLAHYLSELGVGPEILVGICVPRSLEMAIGVLAILKAGGAYVPLDPYYPPARLQFMIEDSSMPVLLTQSHLTKTLPESTAKIVCLDTDWKSISGHDGNRENPSADINPENMAYVIFTSGTTGKPKGILLRHVGLYNLIIASNKLFNVHADSRILQFAAFGFDVSVWETFMALTSGAALCLGRRETLLSIPDLIEMLRRTPITMALLAPSLLQVLPSEDLPDLETIISVGEKCTAEVVTKWAPGRCLFNGYGPAEASVTVSAHLTSAGEVMPQGPSIGVPLDNVRLYVLDKSLHRTPVGVPGELHIGGVYLARGYLNNPELTGRQFISNPFDKEPEARLYKTGDLVRYLPDGNLQFTGRVDNQIKLRGFRIELGEIETTLRRHEAVKEAVVVLYKKEDKPDSPRLAAYVTLTMPVNGVGKVLHAWIKDRLPEYMIPANFTVLEQFPLTPNGKIDRKALPEPDRSIQAEQQEPRTETEKLLCVFWSQVLGIEVTSILTHFFESGGHSLLATQLASRFHWNFEVNIPLQLIFERPILRDQAQWLDEQQRGSKLPPIRPLPEGAPLVLSFAQQRLWFLAQLEGKSATYNTTAALQLEGQLNVTALEQTLTALIQRHHSLRLCFPVVDGEATVQLNNVYDPLSLIDLSEYPETEQQHRVTESIARYAQTPFDLSTGPLLSALLLKLGEQDHVFLFNMHHIISDGWSIGVLIREWCYLYNSYVQKWVAPTAQKGAAPAAQEWEPGLPELPIQYTDYAAWQRSWLEGEVLDRQLAYWTEKLTGAPELLELPTDYPRPAVQRYHGKFIQQTLDRELTQGIKELSLQQGVTVYMTLMAAFTVLLARHSGQTDIMVGSPIANRTHHQTEDLIGFFINTLVLRTHIKGEQRFSELLKQVKQTAIEAYSHQDIPFEHLVEHLNPTRRLSHSPLFQVILDLQNAPEETLELSGLKVSYPESGHMTAKFDLVLSVTESDRGFVCGWEYNTDLFRHDTISRMSQHFRVLLEGILNPVSGLTVNSEQPLYQLPMITEAEQNQLLEWNRPASGLTISKTVVDLFGEQVKKTPDHVAVVFEGQQVTYRELNRKSDRLAYDLMMMGVGSETLIVILAKRSIHFLIAVLGIFKAGGAYLPLNPTHPVQRIRQVLDDSEAPFILAGNEFQPIAAQASTDFNSERQPRVLCLEDLLKTDGTGNDLPLRCSPDNMAYVIYTSGSTGIPKGVMIEHKGMLNHLYAKIVDLDLTANDSVVQNASQTFDISVWQFLAVLLVGGSVHIFNDETASDPQKLLRQVARQKLTILEVVPSFLRVMLEEVISRADTHLDLSHLRWLIPTGEAL
ncbi:MAG: amino acid adenylation domain-containing protein, partial [bacterium]|nr:amino acid adenylation domain-containing protein [bacterium]